MASEPLGTDVAAAVARTEQLNKQWDEIRKGGREASGNDPAFGSVSHLAVTLRKSAKWKDKAPRTIEEIELAFGVILPLFGASHVMRVSVKDCEDFYAGLREKGRIHRAAKIMKWQRYLFGYGVKINYAGMTFNPAKAVDIRKPPARVQVWNERWIEEAIQWAWWTDERGAAVAIAIIYDTSHCGPAIPAP